MKTKSDTAQRQAARKFVEYWTFQRGSEKGEDQQFWNSLLRDVLGVVDVEQCIKYQVPVPMAARGDARPPNHQTTQLPNHQTKYLDAWIPETRVLIEHKSRGVNLDAPQAGHGGLTPYDQAAEYDNIIEGNALRMDWGEILAQRRRGAEIYVIGNPPFRGLSYRTDDQAADMDFVYEDWKDTNYGKLDYVCAWYKKAVDCVKGARCAFVSTNSICQGECVAAMWEPLFNRAAVEIDFAHLPFQWDNEAFDKAHVHCVIVGFHAGVSPSTATEKIIFDGDRIIRAANIDGYLLDAPNIFIRNRGNPPAGFEKLTQGSKPWDGGNLILSPEERAALVSAYPDCDSFIKQYLGAEDLIKGKIRYCLWLLNVSPARYRNIPEIMRRLAAVAEIRRKTKTVAVQKQADTPYLFSQIRQPDTDYLCVPEVSSEERRYIPIGFLSKDVIAANTVMTMSNATPCLFGMMSSKTHTAWVRTVAGRLESRFRYTPSVYNNFPWPDLCASASLREKISSTAQGILDARAAHPDCTLADLYDPLAMPPDLRAAHEANDRAVLAAYGLAPDTPEPEIVAHLFKLYTDKVEEKK